ncbi:MAG: 4-hydroxy-tetrahydrodipicolinate reductase [Paludibacteraceae bacterium]|nr:4-hydroxy-tetrahydrodipicolinate reductase [Paludibacteraceae bacterium]
MKIAIIGYGKMGHMIEEIALERKHEVVARIDAGDAFDLHNAEVAIEFTTPATAEGNIRKAWQQGVPVVCGSTGWQVEQLIQNEKMQLVHDGKRIIALSETGKKMLVWSSNYSVGVNIFFDLNTFLAQVISQKGGYTPSIQEIHHIHKLDKPSGTAKTLAEQILANGRINGECPIESIREGEVPGTHTVTWDSPEDTIVITHIAKGRRGFALGAVMAAEEIANMQH